MKISAYPSDRILILVIVFILGLRPDIAMAHEQGDTVSYNMRELVSKDDDATQFRPMQLFVPGVLMVVGTMGVCNTAFKGINEALRDEMTHMRGSRFIHIDDYLQYLPAAGYLGLGAIGVKGDHRFKERLAAGATAYIVMTALVNIGKYSFRERRPDSGARNSFPSGHTATAFVGAELMRLEYGNAIGTAAYVVAAGVGFLRLYNGRHWLNDVLAGAGIGILSARIGYWLLPTLERWFRWDKVKALPMPSYDPSTRSFGVSLALTL